MSSIRASSSSVFRNPQVNSGAKGEMTRKQKTKSFLTDVLPSAIGIGLSGSKASGSGSVTDIIRTGCFGKGGLGSLGGKSTDIGVDPSDLAKGAGKTSMWGNILGAVSGIADIAMNWGKSTPAKGAASGSTIGAALGTLFAPGAGTAIGGAIGALAGGLLGSIKTGKHKDQKARDQVREFLVSKGILSPDYTIALADGSRFNLGVDGGPKKELGGRRPFEVDLSNPMAKYAISWMNPVIALLSQGNEKIHTDFVGYFANAALSNAKSIDDVRANVNTIMKQFGLDNETVAQGTIEAAQAGLIDEKTAMAWLNGIEERTNPKAKLDLTSSSDLSKLDKAGAAAEPTAAYPAQEDDEVAVDEYAGGDYDVVVDDEMGLTEEELEEAGAV